MRLRRLISQVSQRDKKGVSFLGTGSPPPNLATVSPSAAHVSIVLAFHGFSSPAKMVRSASFFLLFLLPARFSRSTRTAKYREGLVTPLPDGALYQSPRYE